MFLMVDDSAHDLRKLTGSSDLTSELFTGNDLEIFDVLGADDSAGFLSGQDLVNVELEDLISGSDIFGADVNPVPLDTDSFWFSALFNNVFFDTDLTYSSHEILKLKEQNTLYDNSPHDSLIFVNEGNSDLIISDKKADIFMELGAETLITAENSEINLYTAFNVAFDVNLEGDFSKISLNFYNSEGKADNNAYIEDSTLYIGDDTASSIDLSKIEYGAISIEVNSFSSDGSVDKQSLQFTNEMVDESLPAQVQVEVHDDIDLTELLFNDDVQIILPPSSPSAEDISDVVNENLYLQLSEGEQSMDVEHYITDLITEPGKLLDSGQLFSDPLDVFDESDFL
jgi:hypothetical protein